MLQTRTFVQNNMNKSSVTLLPNLVGLADAPTTANRSAARNVLTSAFIGRTTERSQQQYSADTLSNCL